MANAQLIQAINLVMKACLDKLVIGTLYDIGWNPLILNNRLCFSFQAIPDMELRTRAANSWNEYRSKFYAEFFQKWTLNGRESPAVEIVLKSLCQDFKGPKWDMKVNNLISLSTEKRFRLMVEGKPGEAEALKNALRKTVARITDYRLGDGNVGFELTPATQIPQPKESKTQGQVDKEVFAYAKKSTTRKRKDEAFVEAIIHPAKKARSRQSTLPTKFNNSRTSSEVSGEFDPDVVFIYTRKRAAAPRTKREPATLIPFVAACPSLPKRPQSPWTQPYRSGSS